MAQASDMGAADPLGRGVWNMQPLQSPGSGYSMRILLISYCFPPHNVSAAVRTGLLAKHLVLQGHDIRVVSAAGQTFPADMEVQIPRHLVEYVPAGDNAGMPLYALSQRRPPRSRWGQWLWHDLARPLGRWVFGAIMALSLPDEHGRWRRRAVQVALRTCETWVPDVVYASALPYSSLMVGAELHARTGLPWIAELGDMWVDRYDLGNFRPRWLRPVDAFLEHRTLRSAEGVVVLTDRDRKALERRYAMPIRVLRHGCESTPTVPAVGQPRGDDCLRVVYTGSLVAKYRDPGLLLDALRSLGPEGRRVRFVYYGGSAQMVHDMARERGVDDLVETHGHVPHAEALVAQRSADMLLQLLWADPAQPYVVTGKLYEYLGARRPILAVGPRVNIGAEMIEERRAGVVGETVKGICEVLRTKLREKDRMGYLPDLDGDVIRGLEAGSRAEAIVRFAQELLGTRARI